jgi:hypothetical protein
MWRETLNLAGSMESRVKMRAATRPTAAMLAPHPRRADSEAGLFVPNTVTAIAFERSNDCFAVWEMHGSN